MALTIPGFLAMRLSNHEFDQPLFAEHLPVSVLGFSNTIRVEDDKVVAMKLYPALVILRKGNTPTTVPFTSNRVASPPRIRIGGR